MKKPKNATNGGTACGRASILRIRGIFRSGDGLYAVCVPAQEAQPYPMFRRLLAAVMGLVAAGSLRAQDLNYDQVPEAVRRTVEENRGAGVVRQIEVFPFGNVKLYKVQIAINGEPGEEIEVAENGKLIRVDPLGTPVEPDEDDED